MRHLLSLSLLLHTIVIARLAIAMTPEEECRANIELVADQQALLDSLPRHHVMDLIGSQMTLLPDMVRRRLMAARKVESSPALRREADQRVFQKILKEAGLPGENSDAFHALSDAQKERVGRVLLARLAHIPNIAQSRDRPWFSETSDGGNSVNEDFFEVRGSWIDPARQESWINELLQP